MFGFTWATTTFALFTACKEISTDVPNEQNPCLSGGETVTRATSKGSTPLENRSGISLRKTGTYPACPS